MRPRSVHTRVIIIVTVFNILIFLYTSDSNLKVSRFRDSSKKFF